MGSLLFRYKFVDKKYLEQGIPLMEYCVMMTQRAVPSVTHFPSGCTCNMLAVQKDFKERVWPAD